jgi:hypothetical protein
MRGIPVSRLYLPPPDHPLLSEATIKSERTTPESRLNHVRGVFCKASVYVIFVTTHSTRFLELSEYQDGTERKMFSIGCSLWRFLLFKLGHERTKKKVCAQNRTTQVVLIEKSILKSPLKIWLFLAPRSLVLTHSSQPCTSKRVTWRVTVKLMHNVINTNANEGRDN